MAPSSKLAAAAGALPTDRSESVFTDYKPAFTPHQATVEAFRCLYCSDAPCMNACPTHIDVAQFIRKIATGNLHGSARTIFDANILGTSCARVCPVETLCAGACVYNQLGHPAIQIGRLQRYATDWALESGEQFFQAGASTGKRVALIGAGPASLACAHELRRLGHSPTIFEKRKELGGLNTFGVAPHKMKADVSLQEVDWILGIGGIEVRTGVEIGRDVTLEQLEHDFDAVFLGMGLGPDTPMPVPGQDLPGVVGAVAWIEAIKLKKLDLSGVRSVLVIGGGNTALDCVREALTLGIKDVRMVYRGTAAGMPGYQHEWKAAVLAGARAEWQAVPVAFEGQGRVQKAVCAKLDGNKQPTGEKVTLDADLVLLAIGQSKLGAMVAGLAGIAVDKGVVQAGADGATGRKGWFAGGDCKNGGKEVVNAAAEGKAAARGIDQYFRSK
ncbi:MAG: FAD-dependent oxidoreductase [Deltaproteobacteria bacterium]|nr:FAD-dependent oxidoreductase [Deltaproteobacteria bacterium]